MNISKRIILPLGFIALVGACAPYPPVPAPTNPPPASDQQQTLTDEEQKQLDESRRRLKRQEEQARREDNSRSNDGPDTVVKPKKPNYPTASSVPGKDGFVFNPYTHNIVNVKGIASGKLCRDPDDTDSTHKFRVP